MAVAVNLRGGYSAAELRRLAAATKNANQSRRLLSLAAVLDGMNRTEAARIGGMDRQTLRDWVHRFNERGPEGLLDGWSKGPAPRLSVGQRAKIAQLVETGPDRAVHGVVRWRRIDLQRVKRSHSTVSTRRERRPWPPRRVCSATASAPGAIRAGTPC
jgi:transposase